MAGPVVGVFSKHIAARPFTYAVGIAIVALAAWNLAVLFLKWRLSTPPVQYKAGASPMIGALPLTMAAASAVCCGRRRAM